MILFAVHDILVQRYGRFTRCALISEIDVFGGDVVYSVNDRVVYANYGVCIVTKTNEPLSFGGADRRYYVLEATRKRGGTVYVPMDHEDFLRPILSRNAVLDLVDRFPLIETDDFKDSNSHTVEDHFKQMLRENDCLQAMRVAKTMRERIAEQESKRHIPSSMYTRLYDQAVGLVLSEFSAALDMPEDEVIRIMHESDPDALARMA